MKERLQATECDVSFDPFKRHLHIRQIVGIFRGICVHQNETEVFVVAAPVDGPQKPVIDRKSKEHVLVSFFLFGWRRLLFAAVPGFLRLRMIAERNFPATFLSSNSNIFSQQ